MASAYTGQHMHKKLKYTSMPQLGFKPVTPVVEAVEDSTRLQQRGHFSQQIS
jgi:hypothetical protein